MVTLSEELQKALDAHPNQPLRVIDQRTSTDYVLIPATLYERMSAALEEDFDVRDAYPLLDAVAQQEGWDDPEMDSYNVYARRPQS